MEADLLEEAEITKKNDDKVVVQEQIEACDCTIKVFKEKLDYLKKRKAMLSRPNEEKLAKERAQAKQRRLGKTVDIAVEEMPEFKQIIE